MTTPLKYGDYADKSDKWLTNRSKHLFKYFKNILENDEDKAMIIEICEVERELTLREEYPR